MKRAFCAFFAITFIAGLGVASDSQNLLNNPKFEFVDAEGFPEGWNVSHPNHLKTTETQVEVVSEGNETVYRVVKAAPTGPGIGTQEIVLPEGTIQLRAKVTMRGRSIIRGTEGWQRPGVGLTGFLEDGTPRSLSIDKWLLLPVGDSDWQEYESLIDVPAGVQKVSFTIIGGGWTGTAEFKEVYLEAIQ